MIKVCVREDGIAITGHARAAPKGQDIVCAAVSTLIQTFVSSVESLTTDEIKSSLEPGRAVVEYRNLSDEAKLLADSFFIGICGIASAYPEYVAIV